jgi:hypothetical protein
MSPLQVVVRTCIFFVTASLELMVGQPTSDVTLSLEMIPKVTVKGEVGKLVRVDSSAGVNGPWSAWTNVMIGGEGTVIVDLRPVPEIKFYRVVSGATIGPDGFVWVPPGTFTTGDSAKVTLTKGFWISDHEVTQSEYQLIVGQNPSPVKGDNLPVCAVSWEAAVQYCQRLTAWDQAAGRITSKQAYRLPTEAEWEYAARNCGRDDWNSFFRDKEKLKTIAWLGGLNSDDKTHPVKQKVPNDIGLYDMIGNVSEWCSDWYGPPMTGALVDPTGPDSSIRPDKLYRGGSMCVPGALKESCNNSDRWMVNLRSSGYDLGFRPVLYQR